MSLCVQGWCGNCGERVCQIRSRTKSPTNFGHSSTCSRDRSTPSTGLDRRAQKASGTLHERRAPTALQAGVRPRYSPHQLRHATLSNGLLRDAEGDLLEAGDVAWQGLRRRVTGPRVPSAHDGGMASIVVTAFLAAGGCRLRGTAPAHSGRRRCHGRRVSDSNAPASMELRRGPGRRPRPPRLGAIGRGWAWLARRRRRRRVRRRPTKSQGS